MNLGRVLRADLSFQYGLVIHLGLERTTVRGIAEVQEGNSKFDRLGLVIRVARHPRRK
jgi:hypothetical protein